MSDFLDRLAAKALGSESMLVPRLPSLFEPLQPAPIRPVMGEAEVSERSNETPAVPPAIPMTDVPTMAKPSERLPRTRSTAADAESATATATATAAASTVEVGPRHPTITTGVVQPESVEDPPTARALSPREEVRSGSHAVTSKQPRIMPARAGIRAPPEPSGVLLPAAPVMSAPRATNGAEPSMRATQRHAHQGVLHHGLDGAAEPVVHVSIGRLEVRAAPSVAAAPRRRETAAPSSLDNYLRQRGSKVSP